MVLFITSTLRRYLMHNNLIRFRSDLKRIPHHELLVVTHGLTIELMMSCALPQDFKGQPFMVRKEEDGTELRIFKGLIDIYILKAPLAQRLDEMLVAFETSDEIANAVQWPAFADISRSFAQFEKIGGKTRIIVQGAMGLARLQGSMGEFFKKNVPDFQLSIGGDSEIYSRPDKFLERGFKMATASA